MTVTCRSQIPEKNSFSLVFSLFDFCPDIVAYHTIIRDQPRKHATAGPRRKLRATLSPVGVGTGDRRPPCLGPHPCPESKSVSNETRFQVEDTVPPPRAREGGRRLFQEGGALHGRLPVGPAYPYLYSYGHLIAALFIPVHSLVCTCRPMGPGHRRVGTGCASSCC